ncbi:MAG TPA: ADP-ribose diphosphatase [Acetobacteraceae bacterium]|jgi:ADP-ribose pyrophosphatase|nr:ADP-ribose diphosphatase [Acetobacteraceae bacterium]
MAPRTTLPIPAHPDVVIESEQRVWSGRFPLDVVKFRNRRFDGAMSETRTWEVWRRGHASALLPYDPVADVVVLIEQFRFPALVAGIDPVLVELPAGLCEDNEDPADTIKREMREEMNLDADLTERIGGYMLTAGGADEFCHLYIGRVVAPPTDGEGIAGHAGEASEHEDIRVRVWDADEAIQAAFAGCFTNSITAIGLFWLAGKRAELRRKWMTV